MNITVQTYSSTQLIRYQHEFCMVIYKYKILHFQRIILVKYTHYTQTYLDPNIFLT